MKKEAKQRIIELLKQNPAATGSEVAAALGVSREYVRIVAESVFGPRALRRRRAELRIKKMFEESRKKAEKLLKRLPAELQEVLRKLPVFSADLKAKALVLEDGRRFLLRELKRVKVGQHTYLRCLNGSAENAEAVIYYAKDGRWYAVPPEEVPEADFIYVKEGSPAPFENRLRDAGALGIRDEKYA